MKDNWTYKKLGEVSYYPNRRVSVSDLPEYSYVGVENLIKDKGGVSFSRTVPNIDSAIECLKNDILIGNIRPYLRKIWLADRNVGASGDIVVIRINPDFADKLNPNYLFAVLSSDSFFDYDNANTKGAKMPRGDRKVIANYVIPVPSLSEQLHIVSELNLLQGLISKQQAQLKELDNLAQAVFFDMFGDPVANDKGWGVQPLGMIGKIARGVSKHRPRNAPELLGDYMPFIQTGDIANSGMYITNCQSGYSELGVAQSKVWHKGTLCITIAANIGKCAIMTFDACFPDSVVGFIATPNKTLTEYVYFYFLRIQQALEDNAMGVAQKNINLGILNNMNIPVPPLSLQLSFAEKIEAIEKQKVNISKSVEETQKLFDYTMDKYFG